jgi:hypothetical protein
MRLIELHEQLLLEHNVVNTDAIRDYVNQFVSQCRNENGAAWFTTVLAKHLERDEEINVPMTNQNVPRNAPEWLEAAMIRGDDLRVFHPPMHLTVAFDHLCDYLNWLADQNDPVIQSRERLLRVTVPIMMKKADDWVEQDAKAASRTEVQNVKEIFRDGPYRWVEPTTKDALRRDGTILQNCIGSGVYDDEFKSKKYRFFFLHDRKGQPHVAMSYYPHNKSIVELKGKQNTAPVGRYIPLCANFINQHKEMFVNPAETHDVRRMGLSLGDNGDLTTVSETGELFYQIDKVRVFRAKGETGGSDYWFTSPSEGEMFKINIGADGKMYLAAVPEDKETARTLIQKFLNEAFPEGAPEPLLTSYSSQTKNKITELTLPYDYKSKKYGTPEEVSEKAFDLGEVVGYLRGVMNYSKVDEQYVVIDAESGETLFTLAASSSSLSGPNWWYRDDEEFGEKAKLGAALKVFNHLGMPVHADIRDYNQQWRLKQNIYYNADSKTYGSIEQTCPKVWTKGVYSLHARKEVDQTIYMLMRKGDEKPICELSPPSRLTVTEGSESLVHKPLLMALNQCGELTFMRASSELDKYNIFYGNGKWQDRLSAGRLFHKFDDGHFFSVIERSGDLKTFTLYDAEENAIVAININLKAKVPSGVIEFSENKIRASRFILWLFNDLEMDLTDTKDADSNYNVNATNSFLWRMGMFYDLRTEQWKLVQDGTLIHDGGRYRAVKFRNRIFIIDDKDGAVGWFKPEGFQIKDEHLFKPNTAAELYDYLVDFCEDTNYHLPVGEEYTQATRRRVGFTHHPENRKFSRIEDLYPTEVALELPKGYQWVRKAVDKNYHGDEKSQPLHHERYSLCDKDGKSFMRVEFDDDHLKQVSYKAEDERSQNHYRDTSALDEMSDATRKVFIALLEKLDRKLTPMQAKEFGYFRTRSGKYKAIKGNKNLEGYLSGKIEFDDGHEFRCDSYKDEWTLGVEDPDAEHSWDRFKPYLKITLDEEGIESVKYLKKEVKRQPKEYMPYIHKLMKIFATIAGE